MKLKMFKMLVVCIVGYLGVIGLSYAVGFIVALLWRMLQLDVTSNWLALPVVLLMYYPACKIGSWIGETLCKIYH